MRTMLGVAHLYFLQDTNAFVSGSGCFSNISIGCPLRLNCRTRSLDFHNGTLSIKWSNRVEHQDEGSEHRKLALHPLPAFLWVLCRCREFLVLQASGFLRIQEGANRCPISMDYGGARSTAGKETHSLCRSRRVVWFCQLVNSRLMYGMHWHGILTTIRGRSAVPTWPSFRRINQKDAASPGSLLWLALPRRTAMKWRGCSLGLKSDISGQWSCRFTCNIVAIELWPCALAILARREAPLAIRPTD